MGGKGMKGGKKLTKPGGVSGAGGFGGLPSASGQMKFGGKGVKKAGSKGKGKKR